MNVFKKNRKAKDKENVDPFANDAGTATSKMSRSLKRKNKNTPEPKPEFNLADALPDTNDFRTSLLMPGLSARFSMLKEQDDPKSLLGKASDDSVLFPKRASRLNLFSHNPLTDIAETESIRSIPKPFARADRSMSLSEAGYASDDGASVMGRSRPGEGNNLFGGRQKVYRVGNGTESTGSGKARYLYEDDVSHSYHQQQKSQSREDLDKFDSADRDSVPMPSEEANPVSSPMTPFSKNRGTQSSTNSGPSNRRTSTAATSVATCESPIPRQNSGNAPSKLRNSDGFEGNGVTRNPSSESRRALNHPKDTSNQPPMPVPHPQRHSQPRNAAMSNEKNVSRGRMFSANGFRTNSPPPVGQAASSLDEDVQDGPRGAQMPSLRYQTASPSNQMFDQDGDQVYSSSLQPNDRGKATAMGLFNRPRQQYDEQQFLQRQRQMHEDRSSPIPVNESVNRIGSSVSKPSAMSRIDNAANHMSGQHAIDRESREALHTGQDMRKFSSPETKTDSVAIEAGQKKVQARVESLIRRNNAELAAMETSRAPPQPQKEHRLTDGSVEQVSQQPSTFINRFDSSDDEAEEVPQPVYRLSRPKIAPEEVHPALRNGLHDFDFGEQVSPGWAQRQSESSQNQSALSVPANISPVKAKPPGGDSPTLGPNGLGLSGMIRAHLRHDSDRSSIYPPLSPGSQARHTLSRTSREMSMVSTATTVNPPASVHSDPWEFDNAQQQRSRRSAATDSHVAGPTAEDSEPQSASVPPTMSQKAQQILGHAAALRQQGSSKAQRILGDEAPRPTEGGLRSPRSPRWPQEPFPQQEPEPNTSNETANSADWRHEMEHAGHRGHRRNPSTETQKERQAFDDELAERRRKIQEGLRGISESDRSQSPALGRVSNDEYHQQYERSGSQGFSGLRHKTSRGQMAAAEYSNKAMKMLGINNGNSQAQQDYHHRPPPRNYSGSDNEYDEPPHERERYYRGPYHNRPPPAASQAYAAGRRPPHDGRNSGRRTPGPSDGRTTPYGNSSNEDFERARQQSATPNSQPSYGRERAGSEATDRSKSRQRMYRDDEGYGPVRPETKMSSSPSPPYGRRRTPPEGAPAAGYELSSSTTPGAGRHRSNSRPGPPPGHYDRRAPPTPALGNGAFPSPTGPPPQSHAIGASSPAVGLPPTPHANGGPRPSPRQPLQSPALANSTAIAPSPFLGPGASAVSAQPSPATPAFPPSPLPTPSTALASATNGRSTPDHLLAGGRTTPIPGAATSTSSNPSARPRRMTVNKNMISEPTFISSTSSVPLVGLPHGPAPRPGVIDLPPPNIPAMNPRRRGGTPTSENTPPIATPAIVSASANASPRLGFAAANNPLAASTPLVSTTFDAIFNSSGLKCVGGPAGALPAAAAAPPPLTAKSQSRGNRLRKISSEGGGLAARARQQAVWAEREREDRLMTGGGSATGTPREGGGGGGGGVGGFGGFSFGSRSAVNLNGSTNSPSSAGAIAGSGGFGKASQRMVVGEGGMF